MFRPKSERCVVGVGSGEFDEGDRGWQALASFDFSLFIFVDPIFTFVVLPFFFRSG